MNTEHTLSLGALAKALAAAQSELEDAKKDAYNPHFKTRFASLASVRAAITPTLSRHGLAVVQTNEPHGDAGVCVITTLLHESGEWIRGRLFLPVLKKDPQGFGSALSYARRYALAEIVGIASDDDDAEVAAREPIKRAAPSTNGAAKNSEADALIEALAKAKDADELSRASIAFAKSKDKLSDDCVQRARAAHDETLRRLEADAAA